MATTSSPTSLTCHHFDCFWNHCKQWVVTWLFIGTLEFICGFWAIYELIHIYTSIRNIKSSATIVNDIFRGRTSTNSKLIIKEDSEYGSKQYLGSFNGTTPSKSLKPTKSPVTSPSGSSKMQLFETRKSQKLFLFIVFLEGMCRTYEFIAVPFIFEHCEMTKVDRPTLFYAIIADLAPNLFCFAFSCLGYEMSKIFFTLRKPREHEKQQRAKLIKRSLHFVLTITILIVLESSFVNIFFILYFVDSNKYENIIKIIDAIDFYSYAGFCIVLGLYFIRFAIPIYTIYKQILLKLAYQQKKEPIIESSISSDQNVSEQIIQQQVSNKNTKTKYKYKYSQKNKYQNNGNSNIELQTDALNYFVSSMRRTWLMSLYCGVAFILRAVVLLIFADYLEDKWYVLGPYQTIFEIIPNLMMLYIYHYSTKNMTDRYKNVINR